MKSPFKFLDSYTREDRNIFFGRHREIEELYHRVFESKIMLVYGVSGTGKSSLIHCGLANKFQDTDWLPIVVRRGGSIIESLAAGINAASITQKYSDLNTPAMFRKAVRSLYLDHYKPVFFIFDQFEELFIFGTKEERKAFIQVVKLLTESDLQCRMIFVMREEYMAGVTEFEKYIPTFFSNRVRIEKMSHSNAVEAIEKPCIVAGIHLEEGFAEALLERLSPEGQDVELTYLQVYLDKILRISEDEKDKDVISFRTQFLSRAGGVSNLLGTFLEEQINAIDEPEKGLAILKSFVTLKGTKKQLTEQEIIKSSRILNQDISAEKLTELLQQFVKIRILRERDENFKYELRHDSLATTIYEKITLIEKELLEITQFLENACNSYEKRKILLSEQDLNYITPYEDRLFLNKEILQLISRSRSELEIIKKRIRRVAMSGFVAIMIFSLGSIMMLYRLPFNHALRVCGLVIYIAWFLPVFCYYIFRSKENRVMNIIFLVFSLVFLGNIYVFTSNTKNRVRDLLIGPSIQREKISENQISIFDHKSDSLELIFNKWSESNNLGAESNNQYRVKNGIHLNFIQVRLRADELVNYIQGLKIELIKTAEGTETSAVKGNEVDLSKMIRLDDSNVPSAILIGSANNGKAYDLSSIITEYKNFLISISKDDLDLRNTIKQILNLEKINPATEEGRMLESWEHYTFQSKPVAWVLNTLTDLQADVKNCESIVLTSLLNNALKL